MAVKQQDGGEAAVVITRNSLTFTSRIRAASTVKEMFMKSAVELYEN